MADAGANTPLGRGTESKSSTVPYDTNALLCKYDFLQFKSFCILLLHFIDCR